MAKKKIILMSTGGTIVSSGESATQTTGYRLGHLSINALLDQLPDLKDRIELEQEAVSHVDSSSMTSEIWLKLARSVQAAVDRDDIDGVVITHGTDTMEETAYFLHLILKTQKPVVITGAMRPATALSADGILNLYGRKELPALPFLELVPQIVQEVRAAPDGNAGQCVEVVAVATKAVNSVFGIIIAQYVSVGYFKFVQIQVDYTEIA